jgi:hypothetical protein
MINIRCSRRISCAIEKHVFNIKVNRIALLFYINCLRKRNNSAEVCIANISPSSRFDVCLFLSKGNLYPKIMHNKPFHAFEIRQIIEYADNVNHYLDH